MIRILIIKGHHKYMPPAKSNYGVSLSKRDTVTVEKKVFQIPTLPSYLRIRAIYTIFLKNGALRPFNNIFCQFRRAVPVATRCTLLTQNPNRSTYRNGVVVFLPSIHGEGRGVMSVLFIFNIYALLLD